MPSRTFPRNFPEATLKSCVEASPALVNYFFETCICNIDMQTNTAHISSCISYVYWVPEGSLAGVFGCHEMALELVSGADCWCKLMFRASPGDLGGSRGRSSD